MSKITVAIPSHNMQNREFFLRRSLDALSNQTFRDFDILITDNSDDKVLRDIAYLEYSDLDIMWMHSPRKGMAQNTNYAIKKSEGELIKILYLDDYLAHENSLKQIVDMFNQGANWVVTACDHNLNGSIINGHLPKFSPEDTDNFIGSPSVLTIENKNPLLFDEKMTWLLDFDYYKRLYDRYGHPAILNLINVTIGLGEHQMTNILSDELKAKEREYINKKYE